MLKSRSPRRRGIAVALLGPDGAGKSTLAASLLGALPSEFPGRSLYAGPYPKTGHQRHLFPGGATATVVARLTRTRAIAAWHRWAGRDVIFDRHPYDALLAPAGNSGRAATRRAIIGRTGLTPDLIIVLDAPAEVLYQRKGEHNRHQLAEQRQRYLTFAAARPNAMVLDTTIGAAGVLHEALVEIASVRARRGTR